MIESAAPAPVTAAEPRAETAAELRGYLAEFETPGELLEAARSVRDEGFTLFDAHSPFPVHGIDGAMGIRMTRLPWVVMTGGVLGCLVGLILCWYTNATSFEEFGFIPAFVQGYKYLISGKPDFSLPANIPIIFELTILFSAITAVVGMLVFNNLPLLYNPIFNSERFCRATDDRFFISIDARDRRFDAAGTEAFLSSLGAASVEAIRELPGPQRSPTWLRASVLSIVCLAVLPPLFIWKAWYARTDKPRIHIIQDMDNQDKYRAQHANAVFRDRRAMRPAIEGTVARGELQDDDHYYRGFRRISDAPGAVEFFESFPERIKVDETFVRRGQARFDIYCAVCHGRDGSGQGMVNRRALALGIEKGTAWTPPANMHDPQYRERPVGHIFNTITNGIRNMPPYGDVVPVEDRWAIIAYVRALQRSQHGTLDDVPLDKRDDLPVIATNPQPASETE